MAAQLKGFLQQWLISTLAVLVATQLVKGIHYETTSGLLVATLLLGILNTFVRPLLTLLSLPLVVLSLGLFRLLINAALLLLVGRIVEQFHVEGFGAAFWGALVISIVSLLLNALTGGSPRHEPPRSGGPPPPRRPDDDNGPIIDV